MNVLNNKMNRFFKFFIFLFISLILTFNTYPQSKKKMINIPKPPLKHLEKAVSKQLAEGRKMVDKVVTTKSVSIDKKANAYGELARLYQTYELNDSAEACYKNALILSPNDFRWKYSLAFLNQSTGDFSKALEYYTDIKESNEPPIIKYLIKIRIGECYRKLSNISRALEAFESAYKINPNGPAILARLGGICLDKKEYKEAIKFLLAALEIKPEANKLYYQLAMAYRGIGDRENAIKNLSKRGMVGIQPMDPLKTKLEKLKTGYRVHLLSGRLAYSAGRFEEAASEFNLAAEANPENPAALINLGVTLAKLKKYRKAITNFQAASSLAPDNETVHYNLGSMYGYIGLYRKAISHFKKVLKKMPKDAKTHYAIAVLFKENKQYSLAFKHFRLALRLDSGLMQCWEEISKIFSRAKQHKEAIKVLEEAHSKLPYNGIIAHSLARLLVSSPDLSARNGKKGLELALSVIKAKKNYEYTRTIAMAYAELNKCSKAIEWMEEAILFAFTSKSSKQIMDLLKRNLDYFKINQPCRVPGKK